MKQYNRLLQLVYTTHEQLCQQYHTTNDIRDNKLIESAVASVFSSFENVELYPTTLDKGVYLCYHLVKNHGFVDGNKRTAIHSMLVYFNLNHIYLDLSNDDLVQLIINLASGEISVDDFYTYIMVRIRK